MKIQYFHEESVSLLLWLWKRFLRLIGVSLVTLAVLTLAHMIAIKPVNADWATWPTQYIIGLLEKEDAASARAYLGITDQAFSDPNIILFADLDPNAYDIMYWPTVDSMSTTPITIYTKSLLDRSDSSAARDYLGVGSDESQDASLSALGERHVRGDEDRFSYHMGSGGEISGEATKSMMYLVSISFDPGTWYDSSPYAHLFTVYEKMFPNGIYIDYLEVDCTLDPDVEMSLRLCFTDNKRDYGDPNTIHILDTTAGAFAEDDDSSIYSGFPIFHSKELYLYFTADPEGTCQNMVFQMLFHGRENN